ncbi:MAG: coenzyme F420-0:L-glutamate ligase [Promethearchaeati archaeon SRVP18_Atabeyarchaeia-1]
MDSAMEVFAVKTPLITESDDASEIFLSSIGRMQLPLEDGDVIVVASKIVSVTEKRVRQVSDVVASRKAEEMGRKLALPSSLMQLILDESDSVLAGSPGYVLAVRRGFPCVNACIDVANSPGDSYILPPADSDESAWSFKRRIEDKTGKRVAIIIADSGLLPGRRGTIGVALGFAGLEPARNYVGKKDLYGRTLRVTYQSVIDDISSAAKLLMGESNERIPFVIVRGAPIKLTDKRIGIDSTLLPPKICVFMSNVK